MGKHIYKIYKRKSKKKREQVHSPKWTGAFAKMDQRIRPNGPVHIQHITYIIFNNIVYYIKYIIMSYTEYKRCKM